MKEYQLGAVESRFADLIWAGAPIATGELVRQAEQALGWKRTTTYTVLKRLCERGLFQTQDSVVTALTAPCPPFWRPLPPGKSSLPRRLNRSAA